MFISKKKAELEKKEFGKKEYLRGATATAEAFAKEEKDAQKKREEAQADILTQKHMILDDWSTLKAAKKEFAENKASLFIETLKSIFGDKNV